MRIDAIELHVGEPDFSYRQIRHLEAKSEARTALSPAPTHEAVNAQLRALAAQVGADAVINIEYHKGMSMTSWNALKGTGVAVARIAAAQVESGTGGGAPLGEPSPILQQQLSADPLKSSDNNSALAIIVAVFGGLMLLGMILGS